MFVNTENKYIWKNGSFERWNDSNVHILSHTLHYGTGVFEGVRAYKTNNGPAIFRLSDHTKRLFDAASKISISIPFSESELNVAQCETLEKNNLKEVIIATSATVEGQTTAHYISEQLEHLVKVTSLAQGVPIGGELDYLDEGTIMAALKARRQI